MPWARLFLKGWFDLGLGPCVEFSRVVGSARSLSLCLIACHRVSFNFESLSACIACLCLVRSFRYLQLSATDVSARTTMKGAAKCDKHCELQNSVNQQVLERILRFRDIPESMPASVSTHSHSHPASAVVSFCAPRRTCARDACSVSSSTR